MPFINIAKDDIKPFIIDPSDITAVEFIKDRGVTVSIFTSEATLLKQASLRDKNIDADILFEKLREAGVPLVRFPLRVSPQGEAIEGFINPAAVTYATLSAPNDKGTQSIMFAVKGMGAVTSYDETPEALEAFISAVKAAKPVREYGVNDATARWHYKQAQSLIIDPKLVTRIDDSGYDVIVNFGNVRLNVQPFKANENELVGQIIPNHKAKSCHGVYKRDEEVSAAFQKASKIKAGIDKAAGEKFTNELAAANGTLVAVASTDGVRHISRADIADVTVEQRKDGKWVLNVLIKNADLKPYGGDKTIRAYFDDAQAVLNAANAIKAKPAKTKARPAAGLTNG